MADAQNQTRGKGWNWGESGKEINENLWATGREKREEQRLRDIDGGREDNKAASTIKALLF
jgi:hypothetical protein